MKPEFWHQRWQDNQIGFHRDTPNPKLVAHFSCLGLSAGDRVFVPLCGKSLDIHWLLGHGVRVAGAELSPLAVEQFFAESGLTPGIEDLGPVKRFYADDIDIFVGDIFDLTGDILGPVDAIYDRAALVALPPNVRRRYAAHLVRLSQAAPQLLITFAYDQALMPGPPFSVPNAEVTEYYATEYQMHLLEQSDVEGGLKGQVDAVASVWHLARKTGT